MKKFLYIASILSILILNIVPVAGLINSADAQYTGLQGTPQSYGLPQWMERVNMIIRWIYTIFLVVAVVFVLIAAFQYLTSGGDKDKVKKANNMLMYAAISIVIAILAFSITKIVGSLVGEPNV